MISSGESMLDVARQIKERGAKRVFVCVTFGLFTDGLKKFDEYYEKGYIDKVVTTNLNYRTPELLSRPYYVGSKPRPSSWLPSSTVSTTMYPPSTSMIRQSASIRCWKNTKILKIKIKRCANSTTSSKNLCSWHLPVTEVFVYTKHLQPVLYSIFPFRITCFVLRSFSFRRTIFAVLPGVMLPYRS